MISFDKSRKQFVFRQFHVEGFVNQYVTTSISTDGKAIIFTSDGSENLPAGWRARETYKIIGPDEFTEPSNWQGQEKILKSIQRASSLARNKTRDLDSEKESMNNEPGTT